MLATILATRSANWQRIVAERRGVTLATLQRDLKHAWALANEVVILLDQAARDEAAELIRDKKLLPPNADWLTRYHYDRLKAIKAEQERKEQEEAWAFYLAQQRQAAK
jgi:hypothetical protein